MKTLADLYSLEPSHLLTLPNELLRFHVFIYLHSTDLLRAFARVNNRRLNTLLQACVRHLDISSTDTAIVSVHRWLGSSCLEHSIVSLRIDSDHLNHSLYGFSQLIRLDLRVKQTSPTVSQIVAALPRLKALTITSTSDHPQRIEGLRTFIWHPDSCLEYLSTTNCFVLDREDLFPTSSCTLMFNQRITRLSLDLGHICFAIGLMPFVPALEHFELRLHATSTKWMTFTPEFLQRRAWPPKVKSLRFIAYDQYIETFGFCAFLKRFSPSLEHLSFFISTRQTSLMRTHRTMKRLLLADFSHLNRLDFCVHTGLTDDDGQGCRTFDNWPAKQVISILHTRRYFTRFTLPFAFDRLEHVCDGFVNFHCNNHQFNGVLSLPSIVKMTFEPFVPLNVALFTLIQQACPYLRHLCFVQNCTLSDDLVENTILTLPSVTELCIRDLRRSIDYPELRRIISLAPNLKQLTAKRHHITALTASSDNVHLFGQLMRVTVIDCNKNPDVSPADLRSTFGGASVTYQAVEYWQYH